MELPWEALEEEEVVMDRKAAHCEVEVVVLMERMPCYLQPCYFGFLERGAILVATFYHLENSASVIRCS